MTTTSSARCADCQSLTIASLPQPPPPLKEIPCKLSNFQSDINTDTKWTPCFFPPKRQYTFSLSFFLSFFFGSVVLYCPELIWMDFNRLHLSPVLASVLLWHFKNGSVYSNLKVSHKKKRFNFKNNVEKSTGLHRQVLYNVGDSRT